MYELYKVHENYKKIDWLNLVEFKRSNNSYDGIDYEVVQKNGFENRC